MPAQPLRKPVVILAGFSNEIIQLAEQKLIKISAVVDENINAKSCNGLQIFDDDYLAEVKGMFSNSYKTASTPEENFSIALRSS